MAGMKKLVREHARLRAIPYRRRSNGVFKGGRRLRRRMVLVEVFRVPKLLDEALLHVHRDRGGVGVRARGCGCGRGLRHVGRALRHVGRALRSVIESGEFLEPVGWVPPPILVKERSPIVLRVRHQ